MQSLRIISHTRGNSIIFCVKAQGYSSTQTDDSVIYCFEFRTGRAKETITVIQIKTIVYERKGFIQ